MKNFFHLQAWLLSFLSVFIVGHNAFLNKLGVIPLMGEKADSNITTRIVGGTSATQGQFPYQISMQVRSRHICGGSIYNNEAVITAAHCCKAVSDFGLDESSITVVAGEFDLDVVSNLEQRKGVIEMEIHPNYTGIGNNLQNDICILHLDTPLTLGSMVEKISIITNESQSETRCLISGWGSKQESGQASHTLQYAEVEILDNEACIVPYNKMTGEELFHPNTMICAGLKSGGIDSCQGDSGGPLSCNGKLVGIVSFGIGCGRPNYPGIYAKVAKYTNWIKSLTPTILQTTEPPTLPRQTSQTKNGGDSGDLNNTENGTFKPSHSIHLSTIIMLLGTTFVAKIIL